MDIIKYIEFGRQRLIEIIHDRKLFKNLYAYNKRIRKKKSNNLRYSY